MTAFLTGLGIGAAQALGFWLATGFIVLVARHVYQTWIVK